MSLSKIKVNNGLVASVDKIPSVGSENLIESNGVLDGIDTKLKDNFGKNLITSSDDVFIGSVDFNTTSIITSPGSKCLISKLRHKIIVPSCVKITIADGYKCYIAFCKNYGNGAVSQTGATYETVDGSMYYFLKDDIIIIPENASAIFLVILKIDESTITLTDYNKVIFRFYDVQLYDKNKNSYNIFDSLNNQRIFNNVRNWQKLTFNSGGGTSSSTTRMCTVTKIATQKNNLVNVSSSDEYEYRILFFKNYGDGRILQDINYDIIYNDEYDDLKIWHSLNRSLPVPSESTSFTVNVRRKDNAVISLQEQSNIIINLSYGIEYTNILVKDSVNGYNNLLKQSSKTYEYQGITYTYDGSKWNVSGTATEISWVVLDGSNVRQILNGIKTSSMLKVQYSSSNVAFHIIQYAVGDVVIKSQFVYSNSLIPILSTTVGIEFRLRVAKNATVNETVNHPKITTYIDNNDISKELSKIEEVYGDININDVRYEKIYQCAKSYYVMTRSNGFTYGERSALYYGAGEINQVHCGGLSYLMASGCLYYTSRYVHQNEVNESYTAGYGFDFEAYSLKLVRAKNAAEIEYIGQDNVNRTVEQLKELMLFKTSYKLSVSCLRWNMIKYVMVDNVVDVSKMQIGDIIFYGNPNDGHQQEIDGKLIYPTLIEGNLITHCDTVIYIDNGTPYVIDAGAAPISIHAFNKNTFSYVCVGRVPLFDIQI